AAVKRHVFAAMIQATQRAQLLHGTLPPQQGSSAPSVTALSPLQQGCPSAVKPGRAERPVHDSRKKGEEVEALLEAMRKL
ncbi:hypothetical protein BGZ72_002214, partial [Mortierella alpina]